MADQSLPVAPLSESEEIKYRKKCKALKKRIAEIEAANDTLITKLARTKRYVQRTRLERAFLLERLEQIASKDLQAEDAEQSPSPPASPGFETYLLQKHPNYLAGKPVSMSPEPSRASNGQFKTPNATGTPSSKLREDNKPEAASQAQQQQQPKSKAQVKRDRDPNLPRRPKNAFLRFCDQEREAIRTNWQGDETGEPLDLSRELGKVWQAMDETRRKVYQDQFEEDKLRYERESTVYEAQKRAETAAADGPASQEVAPAADGAAAEDALPAVVDAHGASATDADANPTGSSPAALGHADSAMDEDENMTDLEEQEEDEEEGDSEQDSIMDDDESGDENATEDGTGHLQGTPSVVKKPIGGGFTAVNSSA